MALVVYSKIPYITISDDTVVINLESAKRQFDSGVLSFDIFRCSGNIYDFKFTKTSGTIKGVKGESYKDDVARTLLKMYETSTVSTEL